jgi:geranylgeranyl diphosphate synthase type II
MTRDIEGFLRESASFVNEALPRLLESQCEGAPSLVREAMLYSLMAGGKRLRPALVFASGYALGLKRESLLPAAAAVEMVHTYSLIHDDLPAMDNDDYRRGRLTCHRVFGEDVAILAGDALLTAAFGLLTSLTVYFLPRNVLHGTARLAAAAGASGMVGGQILDMHAQAMVAEGVAPEELIVDLDAKKTGAIINCSVVLPALISGAPPNLLSYLDEFGSLFGLMFQIQDDLLDVCVTDAEAGKAVGKDAEQGKLTWPALLGVKETLKKLEDVAVRAETALRPFSEKGSLLSGLAEMIMAKTRSYV